MSKFSLVDLLDDEELDEAIDALLDALGIEKLAEMSDDDDLIPIIIDLGTDPDRKDYFDPDQPRDELGRWTETGDAEGSRSTASDPTLDKNQDGVTDVARVGVPAFEVPPPPEELPRLPNLTTEERAVEERFATAFEADPHGMAQSYLEQVQASNTPNTFATDDAKMLSPDYSASDQNKALYNVAVHQTANAIAKRAFVEYLDTVVSKLPEEKRTVLVTAGGVAAGKGYALGHAAKDVAAKVGAVWDTAGEQNSTELPWVLHEAEKRGIKAIFAYVDADPTQTFERVVSRAQKTGRMVDAHLFADSYAIGARNFLAFSNNYRDKAQIVYISNRGTPKQLNYFPSDALVDREVVYEAARQYVEKKKAELPYAVIRGATIGSRIWKRR